MRAKSVLVQSIERLRLAGCPYRIRSRPRSPYLTIYETRRKGRAQTAKGFSVDDDNSVLRLTELLLEAQQNLEAGGSGIDWERFSAGAGLASNPQQQTWGEIRALIKAVIAPGGPKARNRTPFNCFSDQGFFGCTYADDQVALPAQLETFCLHTSASVVAHLASPSVPLEKRLYNSKSFLGVMQMVNYLAKREISIATPELRAKLAALKSAAGRAKAPAPRFIPLTEDVQDWLDQLKPVDSYRRWAMAMIATYGLRPHEVWHIETLPGESKENPTFLQISTLDGSGSTATKTGHRFALPLPEEWLKRYRLNDQTHSRTMLNELRSRHPLKTAQATDGSLQFWNNSELGRVVSHWMRNSNQKAKELPIKLYGYHQPRQVPGGTKPTPIRERCKAYDLRHAWAIRARETTTWSTSLKAAAMGHSEAIHAERYLSEMTAIQKERGMARQKAHDEGKPPEEATKDLPAGITPEILAMAKRLVESGIQPIPSAS